MKIAEYYSHLNGLEFIQCHAPKLWNEIKDVIKSVDANQFRGNASRGKTVMGAMLFSLAEINEALRESFATRGWDQRTAHYWATKNAKLVQKTVDLPPDQQKKEILAAGQEATRSYNQTDFVKDRVAVEVQFGKYFAVAYDLFVKHLAFFVGDVIDVGVEIVPMKSFAASTPAGKKGKRQRQMSTGVPWYEKELYNLIREGRGVPGVPLVIVGVEP